MAERLRKTHQDDVRAKIQTSQLINRLNKHIDGEIELTALQQDAIKFLINKTLSNAATDSTVEHSGNVTFSWHT
jgi:hypothetical protein